MIKNRQEVTGKMEVSVGEQNVCHEVFHVAWNCDELFHHGFPLTKNLQIYTYNYHYSGFILFPLRVPRQPSEC